MSEQTVEEDEDTDTSNSNVNKIDKMDSLCMSCGEDGVTMFLSHRIPYFREIILASFR